MAVAERVLLCPPEGYGAHHLLNEWMTWDERVDQDRATAQWERFAAAVRAAGAEVELLPPEPRSGAMTFTRDTAVVVGKHEAVVLRNVGRRGDIEPARIERWLAAGGFTVRLLADGDRIDGGNVLRTAEHWLIGIPLGAGRDEADRLAKVLRETTGRRAFGVPLAGGRFGHLDMVLADLGGHGWLIHPPAFVEPDLDAPGWMRILGDRPRIIVDDDDARRLACNVLVLGTAVIGDLPDRLCRAIAALGLEPVPVALDEFRKAGGGAHCLSLELWPPEDQ